MLEFTHNNTEYILFSKTRDIYSQFHASSYTVGWRSPIDGTVRIVSVTCAEMFMMYAKAIIFGDESTANKILKAKTPAECKRLGRSVKGYDDDTWNKHAFDIVVLSNYVKFMTSYADILAATGNAILVEASSWDKKWGTGMNEKATMEYIIENNEVPGQNLLGKAIMKAREYIVSDY